MPGFLLHQGAVVQCAHCGQAQPLAPNPRVKLMGQPAVTQAAPYAVAGCGLAPNSPPCATAQWITAATRIKVTGQPALLQDSQSVCSPTGTPLTVLVAQLRVRGI
jgi:hypothetical protein